MFDRFAINDYLVAQGCSLCISHRMIVMKLGRPLTCQEAHPIIEQIMLDQGGDPDYVFDRMKALQLATGIDTSGRVIA